MKSVSMYVVLACGSMLLSLGFVNALAVVKDTILLSPVITLQLPKKFEKELVSAGALLCQTVASSLGSLGLECKSSSPHITLMYLKDVPSRKMGLVKKALDEAVFLLAGKKVSFATKKCTLYGSKKDFIAFELQPSAGAIALESILRKRLDHYGINYAHFDSFAPHISLGKITLSFDKIAQPKNSFPVAIQGFLKPKITARNFKVKGAHITQNVMSSPLASVAL